MIEIVRIPHDRTAALMGKNGTVKRRIEKGTKTQINVSDHVEISGDDPLLVLKAKEIVTAIGRGFQPRTAWRLLDEDAELHVISLEGETLKKRKRLLGRVIGREGKIKGRIERETGSSICIKGKTLAIIGTREEVQPAEEAVEKLLSGKTHAYALKRMHDRKSKFM